MAGKPPQYYYNPVMSIPHIGARRGMNMCHFKEDIVVRGYKFKEVVNVIE